ncbi:glycosyltransferase, partial [Rhizobium johnstonii]|uniref:glycosyltransferase n=1 Tax=Rhizobium johnstonii TaxID=3019933 RepID=UPI003F9A2FCE
DSYEDTGFTVGDKDELAAALAKLVTDPELRNHLSAKARAHYINNFSMKAYMRSLDKLYEAISAQPQTMAGER